MQEFFVFYEQYFSLIWLKDNMVMNLYFIGLIMDLLKGGFVIYEVDFFIM